MNIESNPPTIEEERQGANVIDAEFDGLESLPLEDRMQFARELFSEVFNPPLSREIPYEHIKRVREQGSGQIKHFFLPDVPGGEGDIREIREGYDERSEYFKSTHRIFIKVGQGEMWIIPRKERPYFQISMSECSAIIGKDDKNFVIAHISYSAKNEIQAVTRFMRNMLIGPENIYVIASVGKFQKERSDAEYTKRAFDPSVYTELGIPESNISPFEFMPREAEEDGSRLSNNLTQIIGANDALFQYSFNLRYTPRPGMGFREEIIGDYQDEKIIKI